MAPWVEPARAERTIVVVTGENRHVTGAQAIFSIVAATGGIAGAISRVFALKPLSLLMEPGYRLFARHRGKFARFFPDPPEEKR